MKKLYEKKVLLKTIGVVIIVVVALLAGVVASILKNNICTRDEHYDVAKKYSQEIVRKNSKLGNMYVQNINTVYMDLSDSKIKGYYSFVKGRFKFLDGSVATIVMSFKNGESVGFFRNEYNPDILISSKNTLGGTPKEFLECSLAYSFLEDENMREQVKGKEVVKIYDDFSVEELLNNN